MRLTEFVVVLSLLAAGIFLPSLAQSTKPQGTASGASKVAPNGFTACPLPIPNCIPEQVFDFTKCRCVPRP
jgi:hypothetical protein